LFAGASQGGALWAWLWLGVGVLVCMWLLLPSRVLAASLARVLGYMPLRTEQASVRERVTADLGRLALTVVYVVVLQATLRGPLVATLGPNIEPFIVEASVAIVAFVALLILFGWAHRVSRPLVEGLAWVALDSLLATSGSEVRTRVEQSRNRSRTRSAPTRLAQAAPTLASAAALDTHTIDTQATREAATHPASSRPSGQ
jgi:hypothetical protein